MLRFFRKDYAPQLAVIMLMIVTAWIPALINAPEELLPPDTSAPLYTAIANVLKFKPWILTAVVFIVFSFSVFFLNSMLAMNQLSVRNSTIGAFTAIVCASTTSICADSYPFLLACPLILTAIQTFYVLFLTDKPESYLFNIGIFLSFASLLYMPSIVLILWALLSMTTFGYKQIRLYFIPIIGFLTPYFIMGAICYFTRSLAELLQLYSNGFLGLKLHDIVLEPQDVTVLFVEFALLIVSIFVLNLLKKDNSVTIRKRVGVTSLLFVFSIFMVALQESIMCNSLIFMMLSIFYAMALSSLKKSVTVNILIALVTIGAFAIQYLPLFI